MRNMEDNIFEGRGFDAVKSLLGNDEGYVFSLGEYKIWVRKPENVYRVYFLNLYSDVKESVELSENGDIVESTLHGRTILRIFYTHQVFLKRKERVEKEKDEH